MILETYQEEKAIEPQEENKRAYGTITAVTEEGINVLFDGETEASTKPFYCNSGISYKVGDRVLLEKINGGYLIVCTVGKEGTEGGGGGETVNVVDDLNSTSATDALSANQGRVLKNMIPSLNAKTTYVSTGNISANSSASNYFNLSSIKILTGFWSNNTSVVVNAYVNGTTVQWRAFNISTSAKSATVYFSYIE